MDTGLKLFFFLQVVLFERAQTLKPAENEIKSQFFPNQFQLGQFIEPL